MAVVGERTAHGMAIATHDRGFRVGPLFQLSFNGAHPTETLFQLLLRVAVGLIDGLGRFPHYTTARLILAKAHLDDGNPDAALAELGLVLQASPEDAQAHRLTAEIHRKAGRLVEARRHLEQLVRLDAGDREARLLLDTLAADGRPGEGSPLGRVLADDTFATMSMGVLCLE